MHSRSRKPAGAIVTIIRRFQSENMANTAAALAFTTLLALVPLVTLLVSVASFIPYFDILISRFDQVVINGLLPSEAAVPINKYLGRFVLKARSLTLPGLLMLVLTAFFLMQTIERTFNHLWQVNPRPWLQRLRLYAFVMVVWPFLMGALATLMSYAVTTSLGFFNESLWVRKLLFSGLSLLLLGCFFSFLYSAVPNVKVSKRAAMSGGIFATVMFSLMQKGFEMYLASVGTFKSVYGAFSTVPIFLIWMYLSWALVLVGGLITATLFRPARR